MRYIALSVMKISLVRRLIVTFFLCFITTWATWSQISQGGIPPSFILGALPEPQTHLLSPPDMQRVRQEDAVSPVYLVGRGIPVNINILHSGRWDSLADGSSICRLKIKAPGAKALGVYYNLFRLPEGAKLFLYNEEKTHIIGAFTTLNNPSAGLFATEPIEGENIMLEYYQPAMTSEPPQINIMEIAYIYRWGMPSQSNNRRGFGDSGNCQVNVNCSEGNNWDNQKRSVVRIFMKLGNTYGWCTGVLMNNTAQDCTPYILTADHCGSGSSASDRNQWIFYFNYQAPGCSNPSSQGTLASQTMTGCTLKASSGGGSSTGSDFYLVQLNNNIPQSYNPFFAGWNRTTAGSSSGVGIHHPSGDIKKISTYTSPISAISIDGIGYTHWLVRFVQTANGHSVPEEGSSGSPLFNSSGLVIGDLTGVTGIGGCSYPSDQLIYGRIYYSWDKNGTTASRRLKDWLDPGNTNATSLNGTNAPCGPQPVVADFVGNPTTIFAGQSVNFTDLSTGNPTSWNWTFTGGIPASSTQQHPQNIVYNTAGTYTVSLTASRAGSSDTKTKTAYITVLVNTGNASCDTLSNILPSHPLVIYSAGPGQGYVCGHNVYGDVAKAEKFTAPPAHQVTRVMLGFAVAKSNSTTRTFNVRIWAADGPGGAPGTVLGSTTYKYADAAADVAAQRISTVTFPSPVSVSGQFYAGIEFGYQAGDTLALASNQDGNTNPTTAWEKTSSGFWQSFNDGTSFTWQLNIAQFIMPEICSANATAPPTANFITSNTTICAGTTISFTDISTGNPTSWNWSFPGGTPSSSTQQNPMITYPTPGTYNVTLVVSNAYGNNTKTVSNLITVRPKPQLSASGSPVTCYGQTDGAVNISASGGQPPYQYLWSNAATSQNLHNIPPGAYSVTVTDANGCSNTASASVTEPAPIHVAANISNSACSNPTGSIQLSVSGGTGTYSFLWNTGANTQHIVNVFAGSYSVTVYDANNCTKTADYIVNSISGPTVTSTIRNVSCYNGNDGSIALSVSGAFPPFSYLWSTGNTTSLVTNLQAGNYQYTVTDAQNCQVIRSVPVTQPTELIAFITGMDTRCGENNGSAMAVGSGGIPPYSYLWSNGAATSELANLAAGLYHVTIHDQNGCEVVRSMLIASSLPLQINTSGNRPTCDNPANGTLTVTVIQGTPPYTFQWNNGSQSNTQQGVPSGTYTVTVSDAQQCTATGIVNLSFNGAQISASIQPVIGCVEKNNGGVVLTITNASQPVNTQWSNGALGPSLTGLSVGSYSATITEGNGCIHRRTFDVPLSDTLIVQVEVTSADSGTLGSATALVSGGLPPYHYGWSNGDTTPSVTNLTPGHYSLTVSDQNGCQQSVFFFVDHNNAVPATDDKKQGLIRIYPNPNHGWIYLNCRLSEISTIRVEIGDMMGRRVMEKVFSVEKNQIVTLDLSSLPPSFYSLRISRNAEEYYRGLIIKSTPQ